MSRKTTGADNMNDEKFIYVFDKASKDNLVAAGYSLIKCDDNKNIYVFENTGVVNGLNFALSNLFYSSTLTF